MANTQTGASLAWDAQAGYGIASLALHQRALVHQLQLKLAVER